MSNTTEKSTLTYDEAYALLEVPMQIIGNVGTKQLYLVHEYTPGYEDLKLRKLDTDEAMGASFSREDAKPEAIEDWLTAEVITMLVNGEMQKVEHFLLDPSQEDAYLKLGQFLHDTLKRMHECENGQHLIIMAEQVTQMVNSARMITHHKLERIKYDPMSELFKHIFGQAFRGTDNDDDRNTDPETII